MSESAPTAQEAYAILNRFEVEVTKEESEAVLKGKKDMIIHADVSIVFSNCPSLAKELTLCSGC